MIRACFLLLSLVALTGCAAAPDPNPAAPGFLAAESDPEAIALADAVMERMGGRAAWDGTRYLGWTFFGGRTHVWDRWTGRVRIEGRRRADGAPYVIIMDVDDGTGRVWIDGDEITDAAERAEMLEAGRGMWINDSYWLVMPYKLKDTGVRLRHLGRGTMDDGRPANVLEVTFEEVGLTPQNRYHVYVGADTGLVEQWEYFRTAEDEEPAITTPWRGWTRHGSILLSGDRGDRQLTGIEAPDSVPADVFAGPTPAR